MAYICSQFMWGKKSDVWPKQILFILSILLSRVSWLSGPQAFSCINVCMLYWTLHKNIWGNNFFYCIGIYEIICLPKDNSLNFKNLCNFKPIFQLLCDKYSGCERLCAMCIFLGILLRGAMRPLGMLIILMLCTLILYSFQNITPWSLQTAQGYSNRYGSEKIRVLTLAKNRGKGGAIRLVSSKLDILLLIMKAAKVYSEQWNTSLPFY